MIKNYILIVNAVMLTIACIGLAVLLFAPNHNDIHAEPARREIVMDNARVFFDNLPPRGSVQPPINCGLEGPEYNHWLCWSLFGGELVVVSCDAVGCTPKYWR